MDHKLTRTTTGYTCSVCLWNWKQQPKTDCPGLPRYDWSSVPPHLSSKTALSKRGLKPTGRPVGCVWTSAGTTYISLYDERETVAKQPASRRQLAALAKGRETQYRKRIEQVFVEDDRDDSYSDWGDDIYPEPDYAADRQRAVEWAARMLADDNAVILDTETTGLLDDPKAEIIQLAILPISGEEGWETLIRPARFPVPGFVTRLTGLTDELLSGAPTFAEMWPEIRARIEGKTIIVYNAGFDAEMLARMCRWAGAEHPRALATWQCAMVHYAEYCGAWSGYHQSYTYQKLPRPAGVHTALGDARATLELLKSMASGVT